MKLAVVGSRTYLDWKECNREIRYEVALHGGASKVEAIIHGGAIGTDRMADRAARELGITRVAIKPKYEYWGDRQAPLARNAEIAEACDAMLAFWDGFSGGTANAIANAVLYKRPVRVFLIEKSNPLRKGTL